MSCGTTTYTATGWDLAHSYSVQTGDSGLYYVLFAAILAVALAVVAPRGWWGVLAGVASLLFVLNELSVLSYVINNYQALADKVAADEAARAGASQDYLSAMMKLSMHLESGIYGTMFGLMGALLGGAVGIWVSIGTLLSAGRDGTETNSAALGPGEGHSERTASQPAYRPNPRPATPRQEAQVAAPYIESDLLPERKIRDLASTGSARRKDKKPHNWGLIAGVLAACLVVLGVLGMMGYAAERQQANRSGSTSVANAVAARGVEATPAATTATGLAAVPAITASPSSTTQSPTSPVVVASLSNASAPVTTSTAVPTAAPALVPTGTPVPSVTPRPTPVAQPQQSPALGAAVDQLVRQGYDPIDTSTYDETQQLRVLIGVKVPTADGDVQHAFFFLGDKYLGTDTADPSASIDFEGQDGNTIYIGYYLYKPNVPMGCPNCPKAVVRFHWDGTQLVPLDPIPSDQERQ